MTDPARDAVPDAAPDPTLHLVPEHTMAEFDPDTDPTFVEPDDVVTALVGADDPSPGLDVTRLRRLRELRSRQTLLKAQATEVGKEIEELNGKTVEHIVEATDANLRDGWKMTVDGYTAWADVKDYPKYRQAEGAEKPYGQDELIPALRAADKKTGLPDLVKLTVNGNSWSAAVRRLVEAWRERLDETGAPVDASGQPVDAFGNVLTLEEAEDPTADALGLPPEVRAIVDVTTVIDIRFRQK